MDMQRIVEKVKKLLARSKDMTGSTEGERETALRMVAAYLKEHNLSMATVEGAQSAEERKKEESEGGPRTKQNHKFFGRPWARCAAYAVADLCFCGYLWRSARVSKDCEHIFIGRESNAVTAALLAEFVCNSIHSEGRRRQRKLGEANPWFLDFAWGAALEIQKRCAALKVSKEAINGSSGKELILADYYKSERKANEAFQAVAFPRVKTSTSMGKGIRGTDGYGEGREYGASINLDRQMK
jgi:hypothetical protein